MFSTEEAFEATETRIPERPERPKRLEKPGELGGHFSFCNGTKDNIEATIPAGMLTPNLPH